jgi:queuosine precursor transporter
MNDIIKNENSRKRNKLFIFLMGFFLTNALIAEMVGIKIFSVEGTLGINPAHINVFGTIFDFNLTAGTILWPFVFISTDIINEYFGKAGVRKISVITAGLIAYGFLVIGMATILEPAQFWLEQNKLDSDGNAINIDAAFNTVFRQGMGIIVASLTAFLLGQLIDVYVFQKIKKMYGAKMLWLRATGSTMISQLIDSFVVLFIAFYLLGNWSFIQVIQVSIVNYIAKGLLAVLLTPLLYLAHSTIDNYLGKEESARMIQEATDSSEKLF